MIEREVIGSALDTTVTFRVGTEPAEETEDESPSMDALMIQPAPSIRDVFDRSTERILEELGFDTVVSFLRADPSTVDSPLVSTSRLEQLQNTLVDSVGDADLVEVTIDESYRWDGDSPAGEFDSNTPELEARLGSGNRSDTANGEKSITEWWTAGADFARTGCRGNESPASLAGTERWTVSRIDRTVADIEPAVMDGRVYTWTGHAFESYDASTGDKLWEQQYPLLEDGADEPMTPRPPVGSDGSLFVPPVLTTFDAETGDRTGSFGDWVDDAHVSIADEKLLISTTDTALRVVPLEDSVDPWEVHPKGVEADPQPPAYDADTQLAVVPDRSGELVGISLDTRSEEWRAKRSGAFRTPAIGTHVFGTTTEQLLEAVDTQFGDSLWANDVTHTPISDPVATDDRVYVAAPNGVYGLDADTGEIEFEYTLDSTAPESVPPRPTIAREPFYQRRVFAAIGETLYAVDPRSGDCEWTIPFDATVTTQPLYVNGRIYLRTSDGVLHAIE
ncbi:PQQ-binding-like beta-propeller repeat protein [Halobaculum sp. WSA2]|uniref:PQQ-binding-like beta-propeller repeat protein n=1 Tax=Halobaculum saliterrae TaxID=2073113 RepID=A0A6B0SVT4_9EURY|nr:PQQ-binding-like beta-propeller repeat protein [Halobaculum saliterrae]MXR40733.1 PQQ-binding-like beta-propeller repeat protein [Halobaculum saliterrae]